MSDVVIACSKLGVKQWWDFAGHVPAAQEVRPRCCPYCSAAAQVVGKPRTVIGHGKRARTYHEVVNGAMTTLVVFVRRFLCLRCRRTVTLTPGATLPKHQFTLRAIAFAIALYRLQNLTARAVRDLVAVQKSDEGSWPQLRRWVSADWPEIDGLPRGPPVRRAREIAQYLVGLASSSSGLGIIESAVQGASYLRQKPKR